MRGLPLMAFLLSPSIWAQESTLFFVIQGDDKFSYVATEHGKQVVNEHLQYEVFEAIKNQVRFNPEINALIFFDSPEGPPILEIYSQGEQVSREAMSEDFTNPQTLQSLFDKGYALFPETSYYLFHWGYTLPIYPEIDFDLSHPNHSFSIEVLRKALYQAEAYRESRQFEAIILSTCFNSSLEILYALNSFTRNIVATEIYLYHRGFSLGDHPERGLETIYENM